MKCTKCKKECNDLFRHGRDVLCKQCFVEKPKRPPGRPRSKEQIERVEIRASIEVIKWIKKNKQAVIEFVKDRLKNGHD